MENNKTTATINFGQQIALHLVEHCNEWHFDYIEKLQKKKTVDNFFKIFCKLTKTYFVTIGDDYYDVTFSKDGSVIIKKCGKDYNERPIDAVIDIQEILEYLPGNNTDMRGISHEK